MSLKTTVFEGKCVFCHKLYKKSGMSRHLNEEFKNVVKKSPKGLSYHVQIEPDVKHYGANGFFLNLWIDRSTKIEQLDGFLRDIWLDCCGHLSTFKNPALKQETYGIYDIKDLYGYLDKGEIKKYERIMEKVLGEIPITKRVKYVFSKDTLLEYVYDPKSPTHLTLKVLEVLPVKVYRKIVLLSRNEPLPFYCDECEKEPAVKLCISDETQLCERCAEKHVIKCKDYPLFSERVLVNSPRMGVCSYYGGKIDKKRDGGYKEKKGIG